MRAATVNRIRAMGLARTFPALGALVWEVVAADEVVDAAEEVWLLELVVLLAKEVLLAVEVVGELLGAEVVVELLLLVDEVEEVVVAVEELEAREEPGVDEAPLELAVAPPRNWNSAP